MARQIPKEALAAIENALAGKSGSATAREILEELVEDVPMRTLQYRLKYLADVGRIDKQGEGRWARYSVASRAAALVAPVGELEGSVIPLSAAGAKVQDHLRQPQARRKHVGYDRAFLESYEPNLDTYLTDAERDHLAEIGRSRALGQPAGTYAERILNRLLIDLSWNSSRLEGNTYSLLDTKRLVEFGEAAEGHDNREAQMVLNHKDAIEFLVGNVEEIGFNRYTILNLHGMLANNLLPDDSAAGRLRYIPIGIESSVFHPLEEPQLIEECFDLVLAKARVIENPFEQALFVMIQLPYLQPFDDVNKRVSRLAANIPFIRSGLSPLSFTEVSRRIYTDAVLGVYELNDIALLKDLFIWAYERSAARYAAVRQSLGEPDPFRVKHRDNLRNVIRQIVQQRVGQKDASRYIGTWMHENLPPSEHDRFRETAETELLALHEGNFARYRITPKAFASWQKEWHRST